MVGRGRGGGQGERGAGRWEIKSESYTIGEKGVKGVKGKERR